MHLVEQGGVGFVQGPDGEFFLGLLGVRRIVGLPGSSSGHDSFAATASGVGGE